MKRYIIGIVIFIVFVAAIIGVKLYNQAKLADEQAAAANTLYYEDWAVTELQGTGIAMLAPSEISEKDFSVNREARDQVSATKFYEYNQGFFGLNAGYMRYDQAEVNLPETADRLAEQIHDVTGVDQFAYRKDNVSVSNIDGLRLHGTAEYNRYEKDIVIEAYLLKQADLFWQIMVSYDNASAETRDYAGQIMDSVEIHPDRVDNATAQAGN